MWCNLLYCRTEVDWPASGDGAHGELHGRGHNNETRAADVWEERFETREFELPAIKEDEILAKVVTNSVCMSDHKAAFGEPNGFPKISRPVRSSLAMSFVFRSCKSAISGNQFKPGVHRFSIQLHSTTKAVGCPGLLLPSYRGNNIIIPPEVMELIVCSVTREKPSWGRWLVSKAYASRRTYHMYHTNGSMCIRWGLRWKPSSAGVGPMGLGAIDYALHCDRRPGLLVVTDIDDQRLKRAASLYTVEEARRQGVRLLYLNTKEVSDPVATLLEHSGGRGYDEVLVMAPVRSLVEQADAILANDGCLNFFAGPAKTIFSATLNFYDNHYASHHVVGTSGGNTDDMRESFIDGAQASTSVMITTWAA